MRHPVALTDPMLAKPGPLPTRGGYAYEVKWDGFRAIVSTEDGVLRVRSRRGWNMTDKVPELASLPAGLVLDGELVAFKAGVPHFPLVCDRVLHGVKGVQLTYVVFDVLAVDGTSMLARPYEDRHGLLEALELPAPCFVSESFTDGRALFDAVTEQGMEGVVAKPLRSLYRPGIRGWVKIKNRAYWRWPEDVAAARRHRTAHAR